MVILYILLFILCLSILIVIHELGHFIAAKAFNVFVYEFSIGFGPQLLKFKTKKAESYFSIRAVPLGGYVSMSSEGETPEEGKTVDIKRSLKGIAKWKRVIIMIAGVTMNALLAIVIFFVSEFACTQRMLYAKQLSVIENSVAYNAGINNLDVIYSYNEETMLEEYGDRYIFTVDEEIELTPVTGKTLSASSYSLVVDLREVNSFNNISYDNFIYITENVISEKTGKYYSAIGKTISFDDIKSFTFNLTTIMKNEEGLVVDENNQFIPFLHETPITIEVNHDEEGKMSDKTPLGISMFLYEYRNDFVTSIKNTFVDFGESATAIVKSLGALFTDPNAIQGVSGPVGIGVYTTSVLQDLGIGRFLYIWGLISVNLAILNLIPFPGLDGWHLLVIAVEAITRKEIPNKVKNIVSAVGMIIFFALMILILIKDIMML